MSSEPSLESPVPVLVPNAHGPAIGDQATGWAFQRLSAVVRRNRVMIPLLIVLMILLVGVFDPGHGGSAIPLIVLDLLWIPLLGRAWWRAERRVGRYVPRIRRLLMARQWRPVPARLVVSGERCMPVIELGDGSGVRLRLVGAPVGAQYVLARHGRVWLVGPEDGVAVIRLDGLTGLILGHVLTGRHEESLAQPLLPAVSYTGSAADDVVASWTASRATRMIRRLLIIRTVVIVGVVALVFVSTAVQFGGAGLGSDIVIGGVLLLIFLLLVLNARRRERNVVRLPALLQAGPWRRVQARFEPWSPGRGAAGLAPARGELDGVAVTIQYASINLMTYARETGTLWIAGRPEPGRTAAVGIAGCPVLTVAQFQS